MNPHSQPLQEKQASKKKKQSVQICSMRAKWGLLKLTGTKHNKVFCVSFLFLALERRTITIFLAAINWKLTTQYIQAWIYRVIKQLASTQK